MIAEFVPFVAMVVEPLLVVEKVISLEESYWRRNCGVETDVMVWAPDVTIPPASRLPELSTRKRVVPALLLYVMKSPVGARSVFL